MKTLFDKVNWKMVIVAGLAAAATAAGVPSVVISAVQAVLSAIGVM